MNKEVQTTYRDEEIQIEHIHGDDHMWLHIDDGGRNCLNLSLDQTERLHRFLGAFLEEIERAKESK